MATKKTTSTAKEETKTQETKPKRNYVRKKPTTAVFVEFSGKQLSQEDLIAEAKAVLTALGVENDSVKKFEFYIQPENRAIFFTADGVGSEDYKITIE
jgi:peptidase E